MASQLSQEEVLDFLCRGGGKVANASLLAHFKLFLRDPHAPAEQLHKRRERFKRYVNSVAVVKPEGAVKYVVLRSRYRDLLGEELTAPAEHREKEPTAEPEHREREPTAEPEQWERTLAAEPVHREREPTAEPVHREREPAAEPEHREREPPAAQVRAARGVHTNGFGHQAAELISQVQHRALQGNTWERREPQGQQPSQWTSPSPNPDSSSSCLTSSPASNTSSPQNNANVLHRSPSMDSKSSPTAIRASPLSVRTQQSMYTSMSSLPASSTSSPHNDRSSIHRSPSLEYHKTSPTSLRASPPLHKSCYQDPITTYLPSIPSSKDCSPNRSTSSSDHPYHTQPPLSFPAGSLEIPDIPYQVPGEHLMVQPVGQKKTTSTNPAFVNVTSRDQEGQKHGCYACTELQSSHFHQNGTFLPEKHKDYSDPAYNEQQMLTFYSELPPSPPSPRYMDPPRPSPSLLFPHESNISPPDVQLEDYQPASRSPTPPPPLYDIHDMWMYKMPVFKSIRCQLSLQDLEDFVDQESCGSEGSDSGEGADCDTEHNIDEDPSSDSNNDKYVHYIEQKCETTKRCPPGRKFLSIGEQYDKLKNIAPVDVKDTIAKSSIESAVPVLTTTEYGKSPYTTKSFLTDQAPILFALVRNPPRHKVSSRIREVMSSSDDELIERDYKKRRRPSRAKRPSNIVLVPPQPDVDLFLTVKPVSSNDFTTYDIKDKKSFHAQNEPKVTADLVPKKSFHYKSSTMDPLDSMEHDWIVKSATGSWLQVYGLFLQDPSLVLRKDFISGFTAFHWFAKHGATDMFLKFMTGAKKAGIQLDANIKSNGGYTPLHIAAIHGHHKVAAMLVEKFNVNVKLRDNSGKRAWQYLSHNTSGEVWKLLGAPKGKTIFASRALNITTSVSTQNKSSQISRKTSLAAFLKPQHQKWKANNHPVLREREIYSD